MRHKILSSFTNSKGSCELFVFYYDGPKDISQLMNAKGFSKDHLVESFWHTAEHNFMPPHKTAIQESIDCIVFTPFPSQNVLSYDIFK